MEILVEIVGQFVLYGLSASLGVAIAAAAYWLWVTAQRRLWGLDQVMVAMTPTGDRYTLEIPRLQVRTPVSRRLFRSRDSRESPQPNWDSSHGLHPQRPFDKTELLLRGQKIADVSIVHDSGAVTIAAPFDSGWDFVDLLELGGGMPTRVSVPEALLDKAVERINASQDSREDSR